MLILWFGHEQEAATFLTGLNKPPQAYICVLNQLTHGLHLCPWPQHSVNAFPIAQVDGEQLAPKAVGRPVDAHLQAAACHLLRSQNTVQYNGGNRRQRQDAAGLHDVDEEVGGDVQVGYP